MHYDTNISTDLDVMRYCRPLKKLEVEVRLLSDHRFLEEVVLEWKWQPIYLRRICPEALSTVVLSAETYVADVCTKYHASVCNKPTSS